MISASCRSSCFGTPLSVKLLLRRSAPRSAPPTGFAAGRRRSGASQTRALHSRSCGARVKPAKMRTGRLLVEQGFAVSSVNRCSTRTDDVIICPCDAIICSCDGISWPEDGVRGPWDGVRCPWDGAIWSCGGGRRTWDGVPRAWDGLSRGWDGDNGRMVEWEGGGTGSEGHGRGGHGMWTRNFLQEMLAFSARRECPFRVRISPWCGTPGGVLGR